VNGKWKSKTTKKKSQSEAEEFAREKLTELEVLKKHDIYIETSNTVSNISKIYYQ
jgi:hypothetical protein